MPPIAGAALSCAPQPMPDAKVDPGVNPDWRREARIGVAEAVFCAGKTAAQIGEILALAEARGSSLLLTRLDAGRFAQLDPAWRGRLDFDPLSRTAMLDNGLPAPAEAGIGIVGAGTSDMSVA